MLPRIRGHPHLAARPPAPYGRRPGTPGNVARGDPRTGSRRVRAGQKPPSRPTAMGASSSFRTGIVAVTIGTEADSSVPSSRTEPSS